MMSMALFWCVALQQPTLTMVEPVDTYFAGDTDFVFKSSLAAEDMLGLELFIDGQSVAYFTEPPYETTLDMRRFADGQVTVRAVLTPFEGDVVVFEIQGENDPSFVETDVHLVRVPVYVELANENLDFRIQDLIVEEAGTPQDVAYHYGADSPLHLTVVLDLSGSMDRRLLLLRSGMLTLLDSLRPGDGVEVIGFNHTVFQISPFETDLSLVRQRLNRLEADGYTNLYGAVWSGLKVVGKSKQRRALVLFTDGHHELEGTKDYYGADLETCLALAQEKGVPIYAMGLGNAVEHDVLEALGTESGGATFLLTNKASVEKAFQTIGDKVSRQYLLCYYSASRKPGWRAIKVRVPDRVAEVDLRYPKRLYFRE